MDVALLGSDLFGHETFGEIDHDSYLTATNEEGDADVTIQYHYFHINNDQLGQMYILLLMYGLCG